MKSQTSSSKKNRDQGAKEIKFNNFIADKEQRAEDSRAIKELIPVAPGSQGPKQQNAREPDSGRDFNILDNSLKFGEEIQDADSSQFQSKNHSEKRSCSCEVQDVLGKNLNSLIQKSHCLTSGRRRMKELRDNQPSSNNNKTTELDSKDCNSHDLEALKVACNSEKLTGNINKIE